MALEVADVKVAGFNDKLPVWWGLGVQPEKAFQWKNVTEGFEAAGMMYKLYGAPCYIPYNRDDGMTSELITVPKRQVIVREPSLGNPDPTPLGVVSDKFVIIQNEELGEWFDPICEMYPLATFGILGEGQSIWMAFKTPGFDIFGDAFDGYLFAFGKMAGGGSFGVGYTTVRVVCRNTFKLAESTALNLMQFAHKGHVKDLVKMRAWAEAEVAGKRQQAVAEWELLVKAKVTSSQVADIIEAAIPTPKNGSAITLGELAPSMLQQETLAQGLFNEAKRQLDQRVTAMDANRLAIGRNLMVFNDEFPQFANTAYAVVNAVTQAADWPDNPRSDTPQAATFGYRNAWKVRAMKAAMKIAKPSKN